MDEMFDEFKINSIRNKFNLQKLVNRSIDLYNQDEDFRKKIHNHTKLVEVNSNL
jgi:hypothetical protein